ncbi:MAG: DUF1517 domain-containing protein [Polyangiales bacterium]
MKRALLSLAVSVALWSSAALAQPLDASTAPPGGGRYTRPPREDGVLIATPAGREVPASEHAMVAATASRSESVGPPRWGLGAVAFALVAGFGVALTLQLTGPKRRDPSRASQRAAARGGSMHPGVEIRCVAVALDWNLRASVEHTLAQVRGSLDGQSPPSKHATASAMRDALARVHPSIRAAAVQTWSMTSEESFSFFERIAETMHERVASIGQPPRPPGPPVGVAIAVLTVATGCPLPPLPPRLDTKSLLAVLESLVPPRKELLLSVDVTWAPALQSLALTHQEAGRLFPELTPVAAS